MLNDAAVVGKVFWRGVLGGLGTSGDALDGALDSLESRDLIRTETSSKVEGDREYAFRHILIRDVAYSTLTKSDRRDRHKAVAQYFEQTVPEADIIAADPRPSLEGSRRPAASGGLPALGGRACRARLGERRGSGPIRGGALTDPEGRGGPAPLDRSSSQRRLVAIRAFADGRGDTSARGASGPC